MIWLSGIASNIAFAAFIALAAWLVQRRQPAFAHMLWVLALVKLLTPPLVTFPLSEPACGSCASHAVPLWPQVLLGVWLFGAMVSATIAWRRWLQFKNAIALADPAPPEWQSLAETLSHELRLRAPEIRMMPGRLPPLVVPGSPPVVLVPLVLLGELDEPRRAALLLHEFAHVKRRDHWVRLLELAVRIVYWWLPLGFLGRQLRICEEACCDAAVVAHRPQDRHGYARLLLDVIDFAHPATATAMSASDLERRLRSILEPRPAKKWPSAIVIGLACAVLPSGLQYDFAPHTPPTVVEPSTVAPEPPGRRAIESCCCPK